jgi:tetratricopeptide (TPR) repeat protein
MHASPRRKTNFYLTQCPSGHSLQSHHADNEQCSICRQNCIPGDDCSWLQCEECNHEICTSCQILLKSSKQPRETKYFLQLADAFFQLAALNSAAGNLDSALELDEQVLAIRRKFLPAFHIQLGESIHNLAHSYFDLERYNEALTLRTEELEIFQRSLPTSDPRISECMEQLALTYSALGQAEDALRCDLAVLNFKRENNEEHHAEIIDALINLSTSYLELGEWAKAIPCLVEALSSQRATLLANDEDIRKTMLQLVELYIQGKQMAAALQMQQEVLEFCWLHFAQGSVETILATRSLAKLRRDVGSHKEAHRLNVEVAEMCNAGIESLLQETFWKKYIAAISGD